MVQLHHFVLQLLRLTLGHFHLLGVFAAVHLGVILSQLRLQGVRTQQGQCDEGAGKSALQDVLPQLETQIVPAMQQGSDVLCMELIHVFGGLYWVRPCPEKVSKWTFG